MNVTLLKGVLALGPASILLAGALVLFRTRRTTGSLLQVVGAGCLLVVAFAHVCEALGFLAWMHWGLERSIGHYLDLWSAVLGLTLFPIGYLAHALAGRRPMGQVTE